MFADIGGNRAAAALTPLLLGFAALPRPPVLTVVKCRELYQAAASLKFRFQTHNRGYLVLACTLWLALSRTRLSSCVRLHPFRIRACGSVHGLICTLVCPPQAAHSEVHGGLGTNGKVPHADGLWDALRTQCVPRASWKQSTAPVHVQTRGPFTTRVALILALALWKHGRYGQAQLPLPTEQTTLRAQAAPVAALAGKAMAQIDLNPDLNPDAAPDETRICFKFLNTGRCTRSTCAYVTSVSSQHRVAFAHGILAHSSSYAIMRHA